MSITVTRLPIMRCVLATVATVLGMTAFCSAAQAACKYPDAEQVFTKWGDDGYYELAPDGGLEKGGAGWTFTGGAELVDGNETEFLNGEEDETSLSLPYKGTATSPRVCVDENTPLFRLMALNDGSAQAKLRVTVDYEGPKAKSRQTQVRADDEWQPTEPLQFDLDGEQERAARISFTPQEKNGEWLVDDLYVDPFARR